MTVTIENHYAAPMQRPLHITYAYRTARSLLEELSLDDDKVHYDEWIGHKVDQQHVSDKRYSRTN
jgi:hypothetical protein